MHIVPSIMVKVLSHDLVCISATFINLGKWPGIGGALETLIRNATGEYLLFLEKDFQLIEDKDCVYEQLGKVKPYSIGKTLKYSFFSCPSFFQLSLSLFLSFLLSSFIFPFLGSLFIWTCARAHILGARFGCWNDQNWRCHHCQVPFKTQAWPS